MKKKILSILLTIAMIVGMLPASSFAEATSLNDVSFWVGQDKANGLDGRVEIDFTKSNNTYSGTLYLPGSAKDANLKLSWDSNVTVKDGNTPLTSGAASIPTNGNSKTYSVTVGGSTANFTIKTMKGSEGVNGMFLSIDENLGTIAAMNADKDHNTSCYGEVSFEGKPYDMSLKGRGNWTWGVTGTTSNPSKKPYNITIYKEENPEKGIKRFDKKDKASFIKDVKSKKWSLLANYADGSLLRNKIGYDIACELGIGLKSKYIDIWMNGKYIGNYLMTPKSDYNAPDGGYALELDNNLDAEDPYFKLNGLDPADSSENVITVKNVGDDAIDAGVSTKDIQEWMQTMLDAVMDTSSSEYLKYIDIDSWAKLYLLQEFYKNHDIICGSILMHRDGLTDNDKLIAGPVWDLDNALGRVFVNDHSGIERQMQRSANGWYIDSINGYTAFLQYLGKHKDFMERVYEIYNEYQSAFDGVTSNLDNQASLISNSASMNFTRWNVNQTEYNATKVSSSSTLGSGNYAYTEKKTSTYQDYLDNLKSYVQKRLAFLSDSLKVTAPESGKITGDTSVNLFSTLTLTADCTADSYQWQSSSDGKTWINIKDATSKTYTATALYTMDGLKIRCLAKNTGSEINTTRVAKAATSARTVIGPVTLAVSTEGHEHLFGTPVVTTPTCYSKGYTTKTCACGYSETYGETEKVNHDYDETTHICKYCKEKDPSYVPPCVYDKTVSLTEGTLNFVVGGKEAGEYTFAKSGNNWTIKNSDGKYLGFSNKAFTLSDSPFAWSYSNNRFSTSVSTTSSSSSSSIFSWLFGGSSSRTTTTTYYLAYNGSSFSVSTSTGNSTVSFATHVEKDKHSFGDWTPIDNNKHSRTCSDCKYVETGDCDYDDTTHKCKVCNRTNPDYVLYDVSFVTGTSQNIQAQSVLKGAKATEPTDKLTKTGYIFKGWLNGSDLFNFNTAITSALTLTAKWEKCTSHEYDGGTCKHCGSKESSACIGKKSVSLSEGSLYFTIGGKEAGEYTFAKSGNKWTIQGEDGKYLGFSNKAFTSSDIAFAWSYSNNRFSTSVSSSSSSSGWFSRSRTTTTTYYLAYNGSSFSVSTSTGNSNTSFSQYVESDEHSFGSFASLGNGTHKRTCSVCGAVETGNCEYDNSTHKCPVCGAYDPSYSSVEANVSVTSRTSSSSSSVFSWLFGGSSSRTTTYTATITTKAVGTTVKTVQYSTDNGSSWKTGTSFSSTSKISGFLIRVTDANSKEYNFKYDGSTTTLI